MTLPQSGKFRIKIDVVTANLIALALFIFCFGLTWTDPLSILGAVLLSCGLAGCVFFQTITWDFFINKRERFQIITWFLIDMGVILMINIAVQEAPLPFQGLQLVGLQLVGNLAGFVIGVGEEVLFGMYGTSWLWRMTRGNTFITLLVISSVFMAYHFKVYGSDLKALMIVFGGRMVLSGSMLQTSRATSATVAHGIINLVSG